MVKQVDLKYQVAEVERDALGFDQKYDLLMAYKMSVEEVRLLLKA